MPIVLSAGLGVAVGCVYGASSFLVAAIALQRDTNTFMVLYFGGMFARMLLALAAVAVIVIWFAIDVPIFVASLLGALIVSLVLEILWLIRRRPLPA